MTQIFPLSSAYFDLSELVSLLLRDKPVQGINYNFVGDYREKYEDWFVAEGVDRSTVTQI